MLYGPENKELVEHTKLIDAEPREVFIIACLLVPIIGIGLYPKIVTQIYDSTTNQLTALMRNSIPSLVQKGSIASNQYSTISLTAPEIEN
jgi:NAD(P)H-quinone oxidoreductase subunit 4